MLLLNARKNSLSSNIHAHAALTYTKPYTFHPA